jgi:Tfp pilus assembly protein PilF
LFGELQKAEADFSNAIQMDPRSCDNWLARAGLYSRTGADDKAKSDLVSAIQHCPDRDADGLNQLAWYLAANPEPELRDGKAAVAFAERAVTAQPGQVQYWNTLGVARYRAGDYGKAVAALEKSRAFQNQETFGWDAFFLAMAHWQLGHKGDARNWYNQAIAWMDKNQPHNEELVLVRAEARAMINPNVQSGVPTTTTAPSSQP